MTLYNTLILSYLSYCNIVWANTYHSKLQPLYLLQKKVVRICTHSHYLAHTKDLFVQLNVLNIFQINDYQCAILIFKHEKKILHNSICCMINKNCNIHSYNTITRENYHLYPAAKNFTLQSFRHHAPKIWNSLSVEIRSCKTVNVLKKKLKKYLLTS